MNRICNLIRQLSIRELHTTALTSSSVFMKPQKKMDPEVAKIREARRRRRLEREIRQIKKHSKKPKPVEEMTIDIMSAKNLNERYRAPVVIPEDVVDARAVIYKKYANHHAALALAEADWQRRAVALQDQALDTLRTLNPELYEAAVQPDVEALNAALTFSGAPRTPPLEDYIPLDGEYRDTTRNWM